MATMKGFIARLLPEKLRSSLKKFRKSGGTGANDGNKVYCCICHSHYADFAPFGSPERKNAKCLKCGSLERHRLFWTYLKNRTDFFHKKNVRLLHFAPERNFFNLLRKNKQIEYFPCDYSPELFPYDKEKVIRKVDITSIPFDDNYFDVIFCNHVLEHIPDDRRAMRELHRVIKKGGWAILQVPIDYKREKTYEDFSIVTEEGRKKAFGQIDHVRWYGRDYKDRLIEAGFVVDENNYCASFSPSEQFKYGFMPQELVYHCKKE